MEAQNRLFPVFLKLEQLDVLVVGGGNVALEKVSAMLRNAPNSRISLVAPFFREDTLDYLKDFPQVQLMHRPFEAADLDGRDLVICTTDQYELHVQIRELAQQRHLLCNVADTPALCDFYLGSIVQKGDLKIAISTNGKSPTLAKRIRAFLEEVIPDDIQTSLDSLEALRKDLKGDFESKIKALNELTKGLIFKK
ncbi:precorrin-2 dehydrogenase/sirohydrochlorin ferrochelatase family protein [Aquirufa ecclesiirivi]|uniref:precorrin-2 dehydrogenase/sirohydrochlorin ferrochelatase family protein n=1 Tax=Aquirufa ecclesiirivi TaxID=2715124 RepID=UPI00140BD2EF|nr:bifunctional precorrin-2 dehydrogenase/sirohydrochlorin ferrochelatase [Aquirufa ecclesiirivi]MCZ2473385.1 bifunctional precorrin-2 dehydrogenase/sirohydrochlorin ferrochelatase [Aquirufa ecclesiirivi]NHC48202.1 bifunctional precorrin-2 dehydrogenase/sirohydrochlorin ferrochelatase [Aquirufa ecclesiirivi]